MLKRKVDTSNKKFKIKKNERENISPLTGNF